MKLKIEPMRNFTLLLLTTCFIQINTFAQNTDYFYGAWGLNNLLEYAKPYAKPEVEEVKFTRMKKGKLKTIIYKFNTDGMLTEQYRGKNEEDPALKTKINYNEKKQITSAVFYDKKKMDFQYSFVYTEKGKVSELSKVNDKGELKFKKILKFDSNEDLSEQSFSYKKSGEINHQWKYEYYDKGKVSHTYYYKKGKLKREWDYMCKEEGEEITKKDFFKVCQFHETKGDTLTTIYQATDHKGKIIKSVYKYTAKDTLPLAQLHFNDKNKLTSKFTFDKSYSKKTSETFYRNGKEKGKYTRNYDGDKIIFSNYSYKGKVKGESEYFYNEKEYLTGTKSYGKNKKFKGESKIEYVFR